MVLKMIKLTNLLLDGNIKKNCHYIHPKKVYDKFIRRICFMQFFSDYSSGFGGKFGIEKDKVDKSAVGWEYHEKVEKHTSQTG